MKQLVQVMCDARAPVGVDGSLIWRVQALASVRAALNGALGEVAAQAGGTVAAITEELAGACSGTVS